MRRVLIAALLLAWWPGAAFADFTIAYVPLAQAAIPAALGRVSVSDASVIRVVYPVPPTVSPLLDQWQAALQDALIRSRVFRGPPQPVLSVSARILEFARSGDTPIVFVRYRGAEVGAAMPFFSCDILTDAGVTSVDDNPLLDRSTVTRNHQEVDAAVQGNIARFVAQLEDFVRDGGYLLAASG